MQPSVPSILVQAGILTTTRTVINTSFRMIYPLLPVFARAVNVEIATLATVITLVQLLGLSAPFVGIVSERQGRKFTMLAGIAIYVVGMLMVYVSPNFIGLAAALLIGAFGKIAFDPAIQAYIGDRVPYSQRGKVLGLIELSWSGAFLLGVPLMTWLLARFGWQAPFLALAIMAAIGFVVMWFTLTPDKPEVVQRVPFFEAVRVSVNNRMAIAGLALGFGISAANQLVTVVFGSWIELSFGIQLAALATAAAVIGASELGGEGVVAFISDRFGKRRLITLAIIGNIIACFLLPLTGFNLTVALVGLFCFFFTFEVALVATLPLATALSPQARAMYMTVFVAAVTFGRAVVTPFAPMVFENGLFVNCMLAVGFNIIALIAVWGVIRLDEAKAA